MLVIRLQRTGRENLPSYRIVLSEKRASAKSGKFQEILGHYLPARDPHVLEVNEERVLYWVGRGAEPSSTIARLLKKRGVKQMERFITPYTKKRPKSAPPPEAAAPAPAPEAAPPADVSAEQVPASPESGDTAAESA